MPVISRLMTRLPNSEQSHLGQVPLLSQVFQSISEKTKEDDPGQQPLL